MEMGMDRIKIYISDSAQHKIYSFWTRGSNREKFHA